jgi:predicted neuraminidase
LDEWEIKGRTNPIAVEEKFGYIQNGRSGVTLGIIQPALWLDKLDAHHNEYEDMDGINAFFRSSNGLPHLYYAYVLGGEVHGPFKTNLPNPNSGVDVVQHDGRLFLVSNPSSILRNPLVIQEIKKISDTEWEVIDEVVIRKSIEEEDIKACISQELSYPYMVENDGKLHLVYTYGRSRIEYCIISI